MCVCQLRANSKQPLKMPPNAKEIDCKGAEYISMMEKFYILIVVVVIQLCTLNTLISYTFLNE